MTPKQFSLLICAIVFSAIILSVGIALQNGIWYFSDGGYVRANRFTGKVYFENPERTKKYNMYMKNKSEELRKMKDKTFNELLDSIK